MNLRTDEFQGFHELSIRRDVLLADSFATLNALTPDQWRRKFKIAFKHEDGMDAGGLSKDWYVTHSSAADNNRRGPRDFIALSRMCCMHVPA